MKVKLRDCVNDNYLHFLYEIGYKPENDVPDIEDVLMKLYSRIKDLEKKIDEHKFI